MRHSKLYKKVEGQCSTDELDKIFDPVKLYEDAEQRCSEKEKQELDECVKKLSVIRNFGEKSAKELIVKIGLALAEAQG